MCAFWHTFGLGNRLLLVIENTTKKVLEWHWKKTEKRQPSGVGTNSTDMKLTNFGRFRLILVEVFKHLPLRNNEMVLCERRPVCSDLFGSDEHDALWNIVESLCLFVHILNEKDFCIKIKGHFVPVRIASWHRFLPRLQTKISLWYNYLLTHTQKCIAIKPEQ